jgi:beta-galactosidase
MSALPNQSSWRLRRLTVEPEKDSVRVRLQGTYEHFEGGYDLLVTPTGEITAHSSFRYTGDPFQAREIGWALTLPRECDRLRWRREAEWSAYPDDHIGRPTGETRAFADHAVGLPPTGSWAEDSTPMGCNDFRSAKRHIRWASLGYADGPAILASSDGSQSVRAAVESDRIAFHINDWYGGTHAGLWEWTSNYGEGKPIANGQMIESTVHLQIEGPRFDGRSENQKSTRHGRLQ